jgi:hypothetical protein
VDDSRPGVPLLGPNANRFLVALAEANIDGGEELRDPLRVAVVEYVHLLTADGETPDRVMLFVGRAMDRARFHNGRAPRDRLIARIIQLCHEALEGA